MRRLFLTLPLLFTAGCGHNLLPRGLPLIGHGPRDDPPWRATGRQPSWEVLIQDGWITFHPAPDGSARTWRAIEPRVRGDVTIWRTGHGNQGIEIVARRTACALPGERGTQLQYEQYVTVRLGRDGPRFAGCGGRVFGPSPGAPGR